MTTRRSRTKSAQAKQGRANSRAKVGRPTVRSPELAHRICMEIAEGKSLRAVCAMDGMPAKSSVVAWLLEDPGFSAQYARAREVQGELQADEIIEIADSAVGEDSAGVQARRLQVEARKWTASKLRPRKYGDRGEQGPIGLKLPKDLSSAAGISGAADVIMRAACAGELTSAEAQALAGILETRRRAVETEDLERRLTAMEARLAAKPA